MDRSDPKSDPSVATHTTNRFSDTDTTNRISTQHLCPMLIKPAIHAVVRTIGTMSRSSFGRPKFVATSVSPTQIGNIDIFSPSDSSTARRGRNADPFDASINQFSAVNGHSTSYFNGVSGVEIVSAEVADINPCERMNFTSIAVFGENPKFMDLGLMTAHTAGNSSLSSAPLPEFEG